MTSTFRRLFSFFGLPGWVRWAVVLAYSITVTWLMLAPSEAFITALRLWPHVDKLLHFCLYGFLVWLIRWAVAAHHEVPQQVGLLTVIPASIGYGILMEVLQSLLTGYGRSFEWLDLVANCLGALCFWILWELVAAQMAKAEAANATQAADAP